MSKDLEVPGIPISGTPTTEAQAAAQAKAAAAESIRAEAKAPEVYPDELITAYQQSALYSWKGFPRYNPDVLVGKKSLAVYADMMFDEQVKAVMNFRRDAVTARQWTLRYEQNSSLSSDEQTRRITLLYKLLDAMDGSLTDAFNAILRALQFGYSLTEKVYSFLELDGANYYYVKKLQAKPLVTFWFECDAYGRIVDFYQRVGGLKNTLDLNKFIYYVHNPDEDIVFGRSELRAAYRSWYSKDVIIKLWNLWMERMAGGFLAVERDPASSTHVVPGTKEYADLQQALVSITTTTSLLLPSGFKANLITPGNTDQFAAALAWHDRAIAKSQLVPNLLGVSEQGAHGSLAQAGTQLEAFAWTLQNISQRLQDCINTQLIYDICEQNFGDDQYPTFSFSAITDGQLQWIMTTWQGLVGASAVHMTPEDESHIRKILDFPGITPEQIQAAEAQKKQDALDIAGAKSQAMAGGKEAPGQSGPFKRKDKAHGHPRVATQQAFTRALLRVDFAVIDRSATKISAQGHKAVAQAMARAASYLLTDERLGEFLGGDAPQIGHVALDAVGVAKVKAACRTALQSGWTLGRDEAQRELAKARKRPMKRQFANTLNNAMAYLDDNSFRMAGNLSDGARSIIQQELLQALKGAKSVTETRQAILERLVRKGFTDLNAVGEFTTEDTQQALSEALGGDGYQGDDAAYIDTLIKTNVFDAMNQARLESFRDPDLGDFVQALEYSAVLDDHTTEICAELNGDTWSTDNPLWDTYTPPNHYNCRSVLIPVTTIDGWDGTEDPVPDIQPQDGFK